MSRRRVGLTLAWLIVIGLAVGLAARNARQSLDRYRALDSGWSWDLAYYNQWFWALTRGDGVITVRPQSNYGSEEASVWRSNYLAPIRLLIAPVYARRPGPETLLIVEAALFWLVVPAAFTLARGESGSIGTGLAASGLVALTPLFVPIAANDFRELQLAIPFALWAVEGVRGRRPGVALFGVGGLLACRQEYGLMVASLAIIPARAAEDLGRARRWAVATVATGLGWTLLFLIYLGLTRSPEAVRLYLLQFAGPRAPLGQTIGTAADFLLVGLGAWAVAILAVPRVALLVVPWVWSLSAGRWSLRYLAEEQWHHIRYAAPFVAIGVAAGVLGFARIMARLDRLGPTRGRLARAGLVGLTALGLLAGRAEVIRRLDRAPRPVSAGEAERLWPWIDRVGPEDGVMADYAVTAPLSSRRLLRSYILAPDRPPGFPLLPAEYRWVFSRPEALPPADLTSQGFELAHRGETISVYHRPVGVAAPAVAPPRALLRLDHPPFELDDVNRMLWLVPAGAWLWARSKVRRAWRTGLAPDDGPTGLDLARAGLADSAVTVAADAPRDLADPTRRVVRLGPATAKGRDAASRSLAAFEAAQLRLAAGRGPIGRLARSRPAILFAAKAGTRAGLAASLVGLGLGSRFLLDLALMATFLAALIPLVGLPLGLLAARLAREADGVDPALVSLLRWRGFLDVPSRRPS